MGKHHSILLIALVLAALTFMVHTEAGAYADANGSCSAQELASSDCGLFGSTGSVVEFVATSADICGVTAGNVPCTGYLYKYNGPTTNQVNVLIPKQVMTKFASAGTLEVLAAGCSQLITNGAGDPTTGFGKNDLTHYVCRIAQNLGPGTSFTIHADPSTFGPLSWQVRISSNNVGAAAVNGPAKPQAPVAEVGASLQTSDGVNCTYTNQGGNVTLTNCGSGSIIPINQTKLCLPTKPNQTPSFTNASGSFTCESVAFATDGCDIKTTGTDPCRYIGGICIAY
jgi:hypothetical protein